MNLYLISQSENNDYDTYDSAVVAAESEEEARNTHPDGRGAWTQNSFAWALPMYVSVKYLGVAADGTEAGVILASFNAG